MRFSSRRGKGREDKPSPSTPTSPSRNEGIVKDFLRGQNLEQVGKIDEAVALYESAVQDGFDAAGPYDRLIFIYQQQSRHADVIRIADLSLLNVRTYPQKKTWYETQKELAREAMTGGPSPL